MREVNINHLIEREDNVNFLNTVSFYSSCVDFIEMTYHHLRYVNLEYLNLSLCWTHILPRGVGTTKKSYFLFSRLSS